MKKNRAVSALLSVIFALTSFSAILSVPAGAETKILKTVKCELFYSSEYTAVRAFLNDPADRIYYTTDGTDPTTKSNLYTKKLGFKKPTTVKFAEFNKKGELVGAVKTVEVLMILPKPKLLFKDKLDGTAEIRMTCDVEGAEIHYTTDGKEPTEKSPTLRNGYAIVVKTDKEIKAFSTLEGWKSSAVETCRPLELVTGSSYNDYIQRAFEVTNALRAESGLYALKLNSKLCSAALLRAKELSQNYENGHTRPNGKRWTTAVIEGGYIYTYASENYGVLDREGIDPEGIMELFMISKAHSDAVLNTMGHDVGFGFWQKDGYCYWIQLFGEPM